MGCSISLMLFTAAFEAILKAGRQVVRGVKTQLGQRLPALRNYMDDVTTLPQTAACTSRLPNRLEELLFWAQLKIKPTKSHSLSIQGGVRNDNISLLLNGKKIPLVAELPVQSLGRSYTTDLSNKTMAAHGQLEKDLPVLPFREVQSLVLSAHPLPLGRVELNDGPQPAA